MSKRLLVSACVCMLYFTVLAPCAYAQNAFTRLNNGIVIQLPPSANGAKTLKLEVISDKIIHVSASPEATITAEKSLMVLPVEQKAVNWTASETAGEVVLKTADLTVKVASGTITFMDKTGDTLLKELTNGRSFTPTSNDGEASYKITQLFQSASDEAFYGLGQHQDDMMNYKGKQVMLLQNNTDVAVPFLFSSKRYGILWDNYSITKFGDVRQYQPLSALRLYDIHGDAGWLTTTYSDKKKSGKAPLIRAESTIDYSFLSDTAKFPRNMNLGNKMVEWAGEIESGYTGIHHLNVKYAGYIKVWIDGKLLVDKWRQAWNPGSAIVDVSLVKGKKYPVKITWDPDGSTSYLSVKCLMPTPEGEKDQFAFASEAGNNIDYYFIAGNNADEVISGYRTLTGKATLMPKWAMGFWQSRERYKTAEEILSTVKAFRDRKIPLDNIVLDWSYWKEDQWGSHEFDASRFPNPAGMIKTLHDQYHTHFMISVWPKFYEGTANYDLMNKNGWLYKRNIANRERDWIAKGYTSTFYDAFNPEARKTFWSLMNKQLYSKGIDAWWMDATEPDIHSNLPIEARKEIMTPNALGSSTKYFNAYPLQNAKGVYEGQRQANPDSRVFILTRSAYGGMQRYAAATWSGDIASRWEDMKSQISAGVNFSLSGLPYWTMDIGGFSVERRYEKPNEADLAEWRELNTRWYQFAAFVPIFRSHGQFPFREIYNIAPENHPAYQSMLFYNKLRYRLMPYIYSLAGQAYQDDYTLMRGLIMDFPSDTTVKNIGDQYMFGHSLLINPVYAYHAKSRAVYLPGGPGWYDLYTGKYLQGGRHIQAEAPFERMPVFVKAGSIIPFGPDLQYTSEKPADPVTLYVYTGKDAEFTLYEDEGTNYNYEKGAFSTIGIHYNEASKSLTIADRKGKFEGMLNSRTFRIIIIKPNQQKSLDFNQQADKTVKYTGNKITIKL